MAIPGLTDAHLHLADAALERSAWTSTGARRSTSCAPGPRGGASQGAGSSATATRGSKGEGGTRTLSADGRPPTTSIAAPGPAGRALGPRPPRAGRQPRGARRGGRRRRARRSRGRRDPAGRDRRPTGVLHERAASLVTGRVPRPTAAVDRRRTGPTRHRAARARRRRGARPGRHGAARGPWRPARGVPDARRPAGRWACASTPASARTSSLPPAGPGCGAGLALGPDPLDRLRLGWLKAFADGSLGSRTAALLDRWSPWPASRRPNDGLGVWLVPPERLREQAASAAALGIATQIHGIGDAAVRAALDALAPTVGATPLMPRVEHAQLVDDADVPRFAALGIAASMQPVHVRSDAPRRACSGEIARTTPPTRSPRSTRPARWSRSGPTRRSSRSTRGRGSPAPSRARRRAGRPGRRRWGRPTRCRCGARSARHAWTRPLSAGETDRGRLVPGHRADLVVIPAAAVAEPVEIGGALWHARPRLVLVDGEVVAGADAGVRRGLVSARRAWPSPRRTAR